jgi:predicted nicotinamide N-methyase
MSRSWNELEKTPIPGGWKWEAIELAEQRWKLLLPADQDAFLQANANDDAWPDPFWTQIWPAARSLAQQVLAHHWPANTSVLELGCGSGLVGLAAAAKGCQVTVSDYVPLAVELAVANVCGNGCSQVTGEVLDWRMPERNDKHDVILAADVLYDTVLHEPLLRVLNSRLSSRGFCWLADPGRLNSAATFTKLARSQGWRLSFADERGNHWGGVAHGEFLRIELRR